MRIQESSSFFSFLPSSSPLGHVSRQLYLMEATYAYPLAIVCDCVDGDQSSLYVRMSTDAKCRDNHYLWDSRHLDS